MDDLRQLLRYEIPGLITIIYFLMLSYPILFEYADQLGLCLKQVSKALPGLLGAAAILALPLGFFIYQFYLFFEDEKFLKKRAGMKVVKQILDRYPAPQERRWWECPRMKYTRRNEVLDIIFYKHEENLANVLERFINFYHSKRVIGIYVPLSALILHFLFFLCLYAAQNYLPEDIIVNTLMISFVIFILLIVYCTSKKGQYLYFPLFAVVLALFFSFYSCMNQNNLFGNTTINAFITSFVLLVFYWMSKNTYRISKKNQYSWFSSSQFFSYNTMMLIVTLIVVSLVLLFYSKNSVCIIFFLILIILISLMVIHGTLEGGLLKKKIDELETNILLLRKREIVEIIRNRIELLEGTPNPQP